MAQSPPKLRDITLPNLYRDLNLNMTFDGLLDWISASEKVTSLLMAIEAVWTWDSYRCYIMKTCTAVDMSRLSVRLTEEVEKRGWSLLPSEFCKYYVELLTDRGRVPFNWTPFFSLPLQTSSYVIIDCIDTCTKPISLLSKEAELTFHFKHPSVTSCNLPGECGFTLKTVPCEATLWTMRLCTEAEDYHDKSVHFHDAVRAEEMHIYFVKAVWDTLHLFPISWLGWLHSNNDVAQRNKWELQFLVCQGSRFKVLYKFDTLSKT